MKAIEREILTKTLAYRLLAVSIDTVVALLITQDIPTSLSIAGLIFLAKTGGYYLFEKFWRRLVIR